MSPHAGVWTVVVAGGSGARFGRAKQFESLSQDGSGPRVLDRSVQVALECTDGVVLVVPADAVADETERAAAHGGRTVRVVAGGASRSASVRAGLAAVPADARVVCVHDAARPFATPEVYAATIAALDSGDVSSGRVAAAVPGVPVTDTIKVVDAERTVVTTPDRSSLVAVQTPQAFRAEVLRQVHADVVTTGTADAATDDASMVELAGGRVVVVEGDPDNAKITLPADLDRARARFVTMREGVTR